MTDKIKDVEIRRASREDIKLFYPNGFRTCYAWIAFYKGKPGCLAGVIVERGGYIAFSDVAKDIQAPKITIWRTARVLFDHIKSLKLPLYAACEFSDNMAQEFLKRLGFRYIMPYQQTELFKWQ